MRTDRLAALAGTITSALAAVHSVRADVEVGGTYTANSQVIVTLRVLVGGFPIASDSDTTTMNGVLRSVVTLSSTPGNPSDIPTTTITGGRVEAWELTIPDGTLELLGVNVRLEGFRYLYGDCFGQPGTPNFNFFGFGQATLDQTNADVEYRGRIILTGGTPPFAFNETIELAPLSGFTNIFSTYTLQATQNPSGVQQRLRLDNAGPITDDFEFGGFTFRLEVALAGGGTSIEGFDAFEPSRIVCCPDRIAPGTFHDAGGVAETPLGFGLTASAAADFNKDGRSDLAVTNSSFNRVDVLLSNGPGTFGAPVSYTVGTTPREPAAADLDGDNDIDLVVVNVTSDDVSVLLNDGTGTFAPAVSLPGLDNAECVALGKIDADADVDIVVGALRTSAPNFHVLRNSGNGTFAAPESYTGGNSPFDIALGDIDGDGDLDAALALASGDFLGFRRNDGTGVFSGVVGFGTLAGGCDRPVAVQLVDFDADNDLDAVMACEFSDVAFGLRNNNGLFTNATGVSFPLGGPTDPVSIAAADFDADNDIDIALAFSPPVGDGGVVTLINDGTGTFGTPINHPFLTAQGLHIVAVDLDQDTDIDLAALTEPSGFEQENVTVLINDCTGAAPPPPCPGDLNSDRAVNTADLVIFLGDFGTTVNPPGTGSDFSADGAVNTADLVFFLGRFGTSCP